MILAYVTGDEVNQELAWQLAVDFQVKLHVLGLRETIHDVRFDGLIYDLDHLPFDRQQSVVAELLTCPSPYPVAVHGYNLDDGQVEALREQGIAVFRCLGPELFVSLGCSSPESTPGDVNPDAVEMNAWVI